MVLDNFSAEYRTVTKENYNYENRTCRAHIENKPIIRFENHSPLNCYKPTLFTRNAMADLNGNGSGVNSTLKSQMMKYRKVKLDEGRNKQILVSGSCLKNGVEGTKEGGYSNALLRFRNLKYVPSTFR